jgi:hypothetical protein
MNINLKHNVIAVVTVQRTHDQINKNNKYIFQNIKILICINTYYKYIYIYIF